ncbi:MAG: hypothetical protein AABY22_17765, partial [Nanoarchaeota archaeon]
MKMKFQYENEKEILVLGIDETTNESHIVGRIVTPAASGKNAIQVCGFTDAYDYWGCAVFGTSIDKKVKTETIISGVREHHETIKEEFRQAKDIQLMFDLRTIQNKAKNTNFTGGDCMKCFNMPCTCEVRITMINAGNPYVVKREKDLPLE